MNGMIKKLFDEIEKRGTIDDKEATIKINTITGEMEITPKTMTAEEFHLKMLSKGSFKKIANLCYCYVSNGKVMLRRR